MADAARITGIALQPDIDSAKECSYDRADSSEHLAVVTVALDSGADQPHQYDFDRSHPIGTDTLVDVPGVGEKAFYSSGFKMLVTLKGQHLLHVSITDTHVADPRRADIAIAQLVLANL